MIIQSLCKNYTCGNFFNENINYTAFEPIKLKYYRVYIKKNGRF